MNNNRQDSLKQNPSPDPSNVPDYGDKPGQAPIIKAGNKNKNIKNQSETEKKSNCC